ncbi:unnamed protein product [marine sediment metagenome]|uniref:Uncharacterized protein n=1 Tax=marine sediment metagenome TaxID=412755 RepID=X1AG82_9ZZZZ
MYDLATIVEMNKKAGKHAKENEIQPLIAKYDEDEAVFGCPDLGNFVPKGWKETNRYFVDNSGLGQEGEPALTAKQFQAKIKEGFGYAIVETGQFQIYIGEFERK